MTNEMLFKTNRKIVLERDNYTCQQCFKTNLKLDVHHIIPRSMNGSHCIDNLVTACKKCHAQMEIAIKARPRPYLTESPYGKNTIKFIAKLARQGKDKLTILIPKEWHKLIKQKNIGRKIIVKIEVLEL